MKEHCCQKDLECKRKENKKLKQNLKDARKNRVELQNAVKEMEVGVIIYRLKLKLLQLQIAPKRKRFKT